MEVVYQNSRNNRLLWHICRMILSLWIFLLPLVMQAGSQPLPHDPRPVRAVELLTGFEEADYRNIDAEWHFSMPVDSLLLRRILLYRLQQELLMQEQRRAVRTIPFPGELRSGLQVAGANRTTYHGAAGSSATQWGHSGWSAGGILELTMGELEFRQSGRDHNARLEFDRDPVYQDIRGWMLQEGYGHFLDVLVLAEAINIDMAQAGEMHRLFADLEGEQLEVRLLQEGELQEARFTADGERLTLIIEQEGDWNDLELELMGEELEAAADQSGSFQNIQALLAGSELALDVIQSGSMNEVHTGQSGNGHRARVSQDGSYNRATIRQTSN